MKFPLLLISIILTSCVSNQYDLQEIIEREDPYLSYSVQLQSKPLFKADTNYIEYKVYLDENKNDSLYGFDFKIEHRNQLIYHLDNKTYFFNKLDSSFFVDDKFKSNINFLILPNNKTTMEELKDTSKTTLESNENHFLITKNLKNEQEFKNIFFKHIISKKKGQLIELQSNIDFQFSNQFKKYLFKDFNYKNTVNILKELELSRSSFNLAHTEETVLKQKRREDAEPNFSNFKGILLKDSTPVDLDYFQSKLIILDYWFMSCYPCIKSFPFLNTLSSQYPDEKLQVIGVNIIDDISKKNDDLKKFVASNNIIYPNIITRENPMNITSHPSIFLVKNGEVLFSFSGHSSAKEKELLNIVEKELSELNNDLIDSEKIIISR